MILIIGGNSSGKSAYAEKLACKLQSGEKLFVATMYPYSISNQKRIEERQKRRSGKGFTTIECFTDLKSVLPCDGKTVLLERITNLVTNEMYMEGGANVQAVGRILGDVERLKDQCENLIVVTDDVFNDGVEYDYETERFVHYLGEINMGLAQMADTVIEVASGCPILHKGELPQLEEVNHQITGEGKMELYIGGKSQSKLTYVQHKKGMLPVADGRYCRTEDAFNEPVVNHIHLLIMRIMREEGDVMGYVHEIMKRNPNAILIGDEVGSGVVPMDPFEKKYREAVGKAYCEIAKYADTVERIFCGLGQRIK